MIDFMGEAGFAEEPSAEAIAQVVSDLRNGRRVESQNRFRTAPDSVVVDVTEIYRDLVRSGFPRREYRLYEEWPELVPPWKDCLLCWVNRAGNVLVARLELQQRPPGLSAAWDTPNVVDWGRVTWCVNVELWIGGRGDGEPIRPRGPVHMWRFALHEDGSPADLHWFEPGPGDLDWTDANDSPEGRRQAFTLPMVILMASLNFLNCRNVKAAEPQRPRPERRRLQKLGVQVQVIQVFAISRRSTAARSDSGENSGVPLHSVRGSFHHYGSKYVDAAHPNGRGLLFGRLEGKFYVPQHARGSTEHGERHSSYRLRAGSKAEAK